MASLLHLPPVLAFCFLHPGPDQKDFDSLAALPLELKQDLAAHLQVTLPPGLTLAGPDLPGSYHVCIHRHVPQLGEGGVDAYRLQQVLSAATGGHPKAKLPKLQHPEATAEPKMTSVLRKLASVRLGLGWWWALPL